MIEVGLAVIAFCVGYMMGRLLRKKHVKPEFKSVTELTPEDIDEVHELNKKFIVRRMRSDFGELAAVDDTPVPEEPMCHNCANPPSPECEYGFCKICHDSFEGAEFGPCEIAFDFGGFRSQTAAALEFKPRSLETFKGITWYSGDGQDDSGGADPVISSGGGEE